jgi:hypothetical protein
MRVISAYPSKTWKGPVLSPGERGQGSEGFGGHTADSGEDPIKKKERHALLFGRDERRICLPASWSLANLFAFVNMNFSVS